MTSDKNEWVSAIESRAEKADYYFQTVLKNQREWYSKKAGRQKSWHLFYAIAVIMLGAIISCLQVIETTEVMVRYITAGPRRSRVSISCVRHTFTPWWKLGKATAKLPKV